jgi:hypothetical protein
MTQTISGPSLPLALGLLLLVSNPVSADDDAQKPVATTPHFALYSDFETNLNDALIVAGSARNDGGKELFTAGSEEACFAGLPSSAREGWNLAVAYYAEVISPVDWYQREQYLPRMELAGLNDDFDARARQFTRIADGFRMAAGPAYEACRWSAQDAENRRWIATLRPRLAAYEAAIALFPKPPAT